MTDADLAFTLAFAAHLAAAAALTGACYGIRHLAGRLWCRYVIWHWKHVHPDGR